jgi:SET domain-containing protein
MSSAVARAAGLEVKQGRHGRGVFARRDYEPGEIVEVCPTVQVADADITGGLRDYVFSAVKERDVVLALGYGMLYNHSADPNLEYDQDDPGTITFLALRPIRRGDELTIDYGDEWWQTRGREPG